MITVKEIIVRMMLRSCLIRAGVVLDKVFDVLPT